MNGDDNLDARIRQLEERLAALEELLRGKPSVAPREQADVRPEAIPLAAKAAVLRDLHAEGETTPPAAPAPTGPPPLPAQPAVPAPYAVTPATPLPYATPIPRPAAFREGTLEQTIGLKWAGWIGALVVVIGAGLGIKYAYDQNWFGNLPPGFRLSLMSLIGLGLLAAGEWVYRRINHVSAAGLFGAGVAILFVVAWAGHGFFSPPLYGRDPAFVLMGLVALIGAAVAMRGNMVSIAVLSIVGANLAPIVLRTDVPRPVPLMGYLLALQIVALALTWWGRGGKWWVLRGLALASTSLWMLALLAELPAGHVPALVFSLVYAALFHLELILGTVRHACGERASADSATQQTSVYATPYFSTAVTGLLAIALLGILRDHSDAARGPWIISLSALAALTAAALGRRPVFHVLAKGYWIQSAALLVLAVPVALSGAAIPLAWGVLALAFAALDGRFKARVGRYTSLGAWILAVVWIPIWAQGHESRHFAFGMLLEIGPLELVRWVAVAWALVLIGHVSAALFRRRLVGSGEATADPEIIALANILDIFSALLMAGATISGLSAFSSTIALAGYAWLLIGLDILAPQPIWLAAGGGALALAMCKWVIIDAIGQRIAPTPAATGYRPLLNPMMLSGGLISLTLIGGYLARRQRITDLLQSRAGVATAGLNMIVATAVVVLLAIGLAVEIDRAVDQSFAVSPWPSALLKHLSWTMLALCAASALAGLNLVVEPRPIERFAWLRALYGIASALAVKYMLIDTLGFRLFHMPARVPPVGNTQVLAGVLAIGTLLLMIRLLRQKTGRELLLQSNPQSEIRNPKSPPSRLGAVAAFLAILLPLWIGSLEIDRFCHVSTTAARPDLLKNVLLSIFWGLFAICSVIVGFPTRLAALRYFGLGLFAVTLLKVVLVDMGDVSTGYRILSFLGVGLLLLGTSVIYGKFSPRLLDASRQDAPT